jgi:hypothetical protein
MNGDPSEITSLINNISEGLSIMPVSDLNKAVIEVLKNQKKKKTDFTTERDILIKVVCDEFSVHKSALYEKYSSGSVYHSKVVLYVIMNKSLGMSNRSIAIMFENYPNSIKNAIKFWEALNLNRPSHAEIMEKYKKCLTSFLEKIK